MWNWLLGGACVAVAMVLIWAASRARRSGSPWLLDLLGDILWFLLW